MGQNNADTPGIARGVNWVPTADLARGQVFGPGGSSREWSPFGLKLFGHSIGVNVATGGLSVAMNDLTVPYYTLSFRILRTFDAQEQYVQNQFLETHPNTDPRFHFFGNWQFQQEVQVTAVWNYSLPEILVTDGDGESASFRRKYNDFQTDPLDEPTVENRLRAYGVPGRSLSAIGWNYNAHDQLLRTTRGTFGILTGTFRPDTLVDPADVRLWRFEPMTGMAHQYTSQYAYQQFFDTDGLRETTVQSVLALSADALGHTLQFAPVNPAPPYRAYQLQDGTGRSFLLNLETMVTYLDGNGFGRNAKFYLVSEVVDETAPEKNTIGYVYDGERLTEVRYPAQAGGQPRVVRYQYDEDGNLTNITDPVGDQVNFEYVLDLLDADESLVPRLKISKITDSQGNSVEYGYDHPNRQVTVSFLRAGDTPKTTIFTYTVDDADTGQRFITQSDITVTLGVAANQLIRRTWGFSTDGRYNVVQKTDPLGNSSSLTYNDYNQVVASVDANGHQRQFTFDLPALPSAVTPNRYDLLATSETNVDGAGNVFPVTSQLAYQSYSATTSTDAADALQSEHRPAASTDANGHTATFAYNDAANYYPVNPTSITDALGNTIKRTFDNTGLKLSETNAAGNSLSYVYNAHGQPVTVTDANGFRSYSQYDPGTGLLSGITDALGAAPNDPQHTTLFTWDDAGQLLGIADPAGDKVAYAVFGNKRLKSITYFDPAPRTTYLAYDAEGSLITLTDAANNTTSFVYDEAGRPFQTFRNAAGNPAITATMDAAGRVTALVDRNGQQTLMTYDPLGRLTGVQEPSWPASAPTNPGKTIAITYDSIGRKLSASDSELAGPYQYTYDLAGNLLSLVNPFGLEMEYVYDDCNRISRLNDTGGNLDIRFKRDPDGNLAAVVDSAFQDPSRTFAYTRTDGALVENLYRIDADTSGVYTHFQYDSNNFLTQITHNHGVNLLATTGYVFRNDGVITQQTGTHPAAYGYDAVKRLIQESDSGLKSGYDAVGNRLWRAAAKPPAANQNVYDADNKLLKTPLDGGSYTYDPNGNLLTRKITGAGKISYTYDGADRLRQVDVGTQVIEYLYDINGTLLERKSTAGAATQIERYLYGINGLLAQLDGLNNFQVLFTRDDIGLLLRRRSKTVLGPKPSKDPHSLFYLLDGMGTVTGLVDWDGGSRATLSYDAWGAVVAQAGLTGTDRFRYRGGYADPDNGLMNFGQRWYDCPWAAGSPRTSLSALSSFPETILSASWERSPTSTPTRRITL